MSRWNNVSGELTLTIATRSDPTEEPVEVEFIPEGEDGPILPKGIAAHFRPGEATAELTIHFLSSGYYDAGQTYGPPESCYPPEGEDERTLDWIDVNGEELKDKALAEAIFEALQEKVNAAEFEPPGDYEPDYREDWS